MRRRLNLITLAHIWVLVPLAAAWFALPSWRGGEPPAALRALGVLAVVTAAYLLARTALVLRGVAAVDAVWPALDVTAVTAALVVLRDPGDALFVLYYIPLASAAATLRPRGVVLTAAAAVAGYLLVVSLAGEAWSVRTAFRVGILGVLASLFAWTVRTVVAAERAAERADFQRRLAHEVHDGVQHLLVTLAQRLDLASRLMVDDPARAARIVAAEADTARRATDELRYLVRRLRAAPVDLAAALRTQVVATADRWPFDLEVDSPPSLPRISPAAEHALLRVIQEGLTNAARHARARRVRVTVRPVDGRLRCTVQDDGVGCESAPHEFGGLASLRERLRAAGGTLEIESAPGRGTVLRATVPVAPSP